MFTLENGWFKSGSLVTSPHVAGQGTPVGGKGSKEHQKQALLSPLGVPQKHQAT